MEYQIMISTVIAVVALLSGTGFVVSIIVKPLERGQEDLRKRLDRIEALLQKS